MGLKQTDSVAVLEELVPRAGWRTDFALFSSYSVDLVAVAAVAIALAGEGDDDERMWKGSLARACEKMRNRFRVVCQAGRIAVPRQGAVSGLVVADQWVRQVPYDGNTCSWHAKLGVVRYLPEDTDDDSRSAEWLLWMGSRNLTRDTSWDSALTAVGRPESVVNAVDTSIGEAVTVVAGHAGLPGWTETVRRELSGVHWSWPSEIEEVVSFRLWENGDKATRLPDLPADSSRVMAMCPFVDPKVARTIGRATLAPQRNLVTTPGTLAKLASDPSVLKTFTSLHHVISATPVDEGETDEDETGDDQMTEVHRGLHAKLVWARSPRGDDLWLGSANLTGRGWRGLNAEVVAHLRVTPSIGNDLAELVDGLEEIPLEEILTEESDEEIEGADALDKLRNRIAGSWCGELQRMDQSGRWRCTTSTPPMTQTDKAVLSARLLGQHHSQAVTWAADRREVDFEQTQPHEETELVVLQLVWNEDAEVRASWVQRAPMNPPPSPERDREALGRLMGPRAMLAWIRSILEEFSGEAEDSPWPEPNGRPGGSGAAARPTKPPTPSLEAVLRAWIRDPKCVREADRVLQTWAKAAKTGVNGDPEAFAELERFQKAWEIVRDGLGAGSH